MTADRTETGRDHATSALPPAPTAAVDDGETVETSAYDATGLRRQKTAGGSTTHFVWDRVNLLAELDDTLARLAQYTDYPGVWGGLSSQRRNSTSSYYAFDLSANTRALFNGAGITDRYLYGAFGVEQIVTGSTENPMRFGGQVGYFRDLAERLYVRARWYEVGVGRWVSRDPAIPPYLLQAGYLYAMDSPASLGDPSGLQALPQPPAYPPVPPRSAALAEVIPLPVAAADCLWSASLLASIPLLCAGSCALDVATSKEERKILEEAGRQHARRFKCKPAPKQSDPKDDISAGCRACRNGCHKHCRKTYLERPIWRCIFSDLESDRARFNGCFMECNRLRRDCVKRLPPWFDPELPPGALSRADPGTCKSSSLSPVKARGL